MLLFSDWVYVYLVSSRGSFFCLLILPPGHQSKSRPPRLILCINEEKNLRWLYIIHSAWFKSTKRFHWCTTFFVRLFCWSWRNWIHSKVSIRRGDENGSKCAQKLRLGQISLYGLQCFCRRLLLIFEALSRGFRVLCKSYDAWNMCTHTCVTKRVWCGATAGCRSVEHTLETK